MKFIVDTQLPPRLATYLTEQGYDCVHTTDFEDGHLLEDDEIILIATEQDRTVITKDSDFSEYFLLRGAPPTVLLIEFGNIGNAQLIALFDQYFHKKYLVVWKPSLFIAGKKNATGEFILTVMI